MLLLAILLDKLSRISRYKCFWHLFVITHKKGDVRCGLSNIKQNEKGIVVTFHNSLIIFCSLIISIITHITIFFNLFIFYATTRCSISRSNKNERALEFFSSSSSSRLLWDLKWTLDMILKIESASLLKYRHMSYRITVIITVFSLVLSVFFHFKKIICLKNIFLKQQALFWFGTIIVTFF